MTTINQHHNEQESNGELKGIQESLITVLDSKFHTLPDKITNEINVQDNIITLKDWLTKVTLANSIDEVEAIIPSKENG